MKLRILNQGEDWIAVDKPAGFFVHPPAFDGEGPANTMYSGPTCLKALRDQINRYVYPVHRLDRATSGVLLFALSAERAQDLAQAFAEQRVQKRYIAVTRGWAPEHGVQDAELDDKAATTEFRRLARLELPIPVDKYPASRFSLIEAFPRTGRMHQIRRHMTRLAHPLIGDSVYGDGKPSRIFKAHVGVAGLCLKAYELHVPGLPPLRSRFDGKWHRVFDAFGVCPV